MIHVNSAPPLIFIAGPQEHLVLQVPAILDAVFESTLNMINQDFSEYPEHRVGFFRMLRTFNLYCYPGTLSFAIHDPFMTPIL